MATLALAANAPALAAINPFAAAGMGILASYFDNNILLKGMLGPDDPEPPEFAGISVQGSGEDSPYMFCLGPEAAVAGTVIWTKREYDIVEESQNNKGGPTVTTQSFFTDVTYSVCETFNMEGIVSIDRMDLDAKVFFSVYSDVEFVGWQYSVELVTREIPNPSDISGPPTVTIPTGQSIIRALAPSAPLLTALIHGMRVQVSGAIDSGHNQSVVVVETGTEQSGLTWAIIDYERGTPFPDTAGAAMGTLQNPVRFFQDVPEFSNTTVSEVTKTLGTFEQDPIPEIEEEEGLGVAPKFSGLAMVTLRGLALVDFGNRIPNANFVIAAHTQITVAEGIRQTILHFIPDFGEDKIDVSNLKDQLVRGYSMGGIQSVATMLQPLMVAFDIIVSERDGALVFYDRADVPVTDLAEILLGASSGRAGIVDIEVSEPFDAILPKSVTVTYIDPEGNYETASTKEPRADNPHGFDAVVRLPITMRGDEARAIARRLLWAPEATRQAISINIMPSEVHLHAGSVVRFTVRGKVWKMLISKLDVGADWSMQAEGVGIIDTLENLPSTGYEEGGSAYGIGSRPYIPPVATLLILDAPPLSADHVRTPGMYIGLCSQDFYAEWLGGRIYLKSTSTDTYTLHSQQVREATMGHFLTDLPPGNTSVINRNAYVDVQLYHGSLQTVTEDEMLAGANTIIIAGEVLAFIDVTPLGFNQYRLYKLARGLKGTEPHARTETTTIGAQFMLIDSGVKFSELAPSRINQTDTYKAIALGGELDDQAEVPVTHEVRNVTNTTVSHIRGANGFNAEILITWNRRCRFPNQLLGPAEQPNHNATESYNVRIYQGMSDTLVQNWVVNDPRWLYNGFSRNADGNGSGSPFRIEIEQAGDYNQGLTTHAILPTRS